MIVLSGKSTWSRQAPVHLAFPGISVFAMYEKDNLTQNLSPDGGPVF